MIVVADTSPLNYLILIDQIQVLRIPIQTHLHTSRRAKRIAAVQDPGSRQSLVRRSAPMLEVRAPKLQGRPSAPGLDAGEQEAIALASELSARVLIIDEAIGRREAVRLGLEVIGTLGILRDAHLAGLLELRETIDRLRATSFRADPDIVERLLRP